MSLYFADPLNQVVAAEYAFEVPLMNPFTKEELDIPLNGIIDVIEDGDVVGELKNTAKKETLESSRGMKDFERLFYLAQKVLEGIRSSLFYPHTSLLCGDCEYVPQCREWQGD